MRFILASESARRVELLRRAGYDFEARRSGFPEVSREDPADTAEENARGKALAVAREEPGSLVLASDTVVYEPGAGVLGQAADAAEVRRMLGLLSGREHEVYTAVAVVTPGSDTDVRREVTRVGMREVSEAEQEAYAADGEGVGKAGGYAIQGLAAIFVERIQGDYTSVVGLPLSLTARMLAAHGVRWYG
ncbi:Maf family protein [Rubrobacter aplysinae]|uniref:Maf family protein n=1 Tax=Rubrobacter aplysinae TaxID=909625 RepID=UPI00064BECDC|nr:Maf family protein [Rubrobacter aplysinae]